MRLSFPLIPEYSITLRTTNPLPLCADLPNQSMLTPPYRGDGSGSRSGSPGTLPHRMSYIDLVPDQCWTPHTSPGPAQGSPNCFEQDLWCQRAAGGCSPSAHRPPPLFTRVRSVPQGSWWGQCENPGLVLRTPELL